ncbi:hypothetical protein MVEN_00074600 [Mycena venus]|uniref:Uncharacterized protein n=1 Tax=Mycena venus TaxID=2733690 RepID=A0A8H6ZAH7_9AGAR|nr:hypothetical protein MVEN_00074600 [Mycena venus]
MGRGHPPAAPQQSGLLFSSLGARDSLLAHHRHLDSLLDSALATLTLIHESESTTDSPIPYSPHLLGVFYLLSCQMTTQTTTTTVPASFPTPAATQLDSPPAPAPATYADVSQSPAAPETNMAKSPAIADSPACQPPTQKHAHVIIRLEKLREQSHLPPLKSRPGAAALYGAITTALRLLFSNMAHEKLFPSRREMDKESKYRSTHGGGHCQVFSWPQ